MDPDKGYVRHRDKGHDLWTWVCVRMRIYVQVTTTTSNVRLGTSGKTILLAYRDSHDEYGAKVLV